MKIAKRKILILLVTFNLLSTALTAEAVNYTETLIPGYVTVKYPSQVTLKSSGCQNINFEYLIEEDLSLENTVWLVQILHLTKKQLFGEAAWFSVMTYKGEEAIPSLPRAGKRTAKVCRKQWTQKSSETTRTYTGIKPGKYRLYLAGVTLDPVTGDMLGEKTEFFKSIVFK
jgi:hypothetical protein